MHARRQTTNDVGVAGVARGSSVTIYTSSGHDVLVPVIVQKGKQTHDASRALRDSEPEYQGWCRMRRVGQCPSDMWHGLATGNHPSLKDTHSHRLHAELHIYYCKSQAFLGRREGLLCHHQSKACFQPGAAGHAIVWC
jgi:hypothetical protein